MSYEEKVTLVISIISIILGLLTVLINSRND